MAGRIILDSIKIVPKILRYARRFGDNAAKEKFGEIRFGAAKHIDTGGGFARDVDRARGIDKQVVSANYKRLFGEKPDKDDFQYNKREVLRALKEEGGSKKIMYEAKGGFIDMTKDKKYYKGML